MAETLDLPPFYDLIIDEKGYVSEEWQGFFRDLVNVLNEHIGAGGDAHALANAMAAGFAPPTP